MLAFVCLALSRSAILNASASPPTNVVIQPTSQIRQIFGSAMFSVTAESTLPLSYQWVFNGEPIANATNADLILGPLNCAQSGYYNVIVSNAAGAVSRAKAQLTVYQAMVSTPSSANYQGFLLQFTNVMAVTSGSGTLYALNSDGTVAAYIPYTAPEFYPKFHGCDAVFIFFRLWRDVTR